MTADGKVGTPLPQGALTLMGRGQEEQGTNPTLVRADSRGGGSGPRRDRTQLRAEQPPAHPVRRVSGTLA